MPSAGFGPSHWATANGSESRRRCSTIPRRSCSTSRRTPSIPPASSGCARACYGERGEAPVTWASSPPLDEVARIADRIVVMNAGRLIGELAPDTPEIEHAFFEAVRADDQERDEKRDEKAAS